MDALFVQTTFTQMKNRLNLSMLVAAISLGISVGKSLCQENGGGIGANLRPRVGPIEVRLPLVNPPRDTILDIGSFYPLGAPLKDSPIRQRTVFPPGLVSPRFGEFVFGTGSREQRYAFVIDELESENPVFLVDCNGNGDLRDDQVVTLKWYGANYSDPGRKGLVGVGTVDLSFGNEIFPADLQCNFPLNSESVFANCSYIPKYSRRGIIRLGDREVEAMLYDDSALADFSNPSSTFRLDLSGDGRSFREEESESFPVTETFSIDGVTYRLTNLTPAGDSFTLEPTTGWVGKRSPTFSSADLKGNPIYFPADYRGRVVFVHIWSPYRDQRGGKWSYGLDENPYLKAAWEKYREAGFELLGVCAEYGNGKEKLPEILEQHGVFWPQICDGKGPDHDPILEAFQTHSVPCNFLIDGSSGKVLAMATPGKDLDAVLGQFLKGTSSGSSPSNSTQALPVAPVVMPDSGVGGPQLQSFVEMLEHGPDQVCLPLGLTMPPTLEQDLKGLKDGLVVEGKAGLVADLERYRAAYAVTASMLEILAERNASTDVTVWEARRAALRPFLQDRIAAFKEAQGKLP